MSSKKTFLKEERLCSKVLLSALFTTGSSFLLYPYRVTWLLATLPQNTPAQVVIGVSKKKFKKSVDRNLIKRKIKEAYRLNKAQLLYADLESCNNKIIFSVNYIAKDILAFDTISVKLKNTLQMLSKQVNVVKP